METLTRREKNILIDRVLNQIVEDLAKNDLTALEELLQFVPEKILNNYLEEDICK